MRYEDAGVHLEAARGWVMWLRERVGAQIGPFAAGIPLDDRTHLVGTTDGVGTKILLLHAHRRWDVAGQDVVAMCLNDLYAVGAVPVGFYDYLAVPSLQDEKPLKALMEGLLKALEEANTLLLGGETAELPGFFQEGVPFDIAGFALGTVSREVLHRKETVRPGDLLVGLPSTGPHSNGYSLIRRILEHVSPPPEILEALLVPTRLYTRVPDLFASGAVKAAAHITGGGFEENLPRALPEGLGAEIALPSPPEVFRWLMSTGKVSFQEAARVWNLGVGFVLVMEPTQLGSVVKAYPDARVIGKVVEGEGVRIHKEVDHA